MKKQLPSISHLGDLKSSHSLSFFLILFLPSLILILCPLLLFILFPYQHHVTSDGYYDSTVSPTHKLNRPPKVVYIISRLVS
jgi:hypothetical protein